MKEEGENLKRILEQSGSDSQVDEVAPKGPFHCILLRY